jgi:hypothetical protein
MSDEENLIECDSLATVVIHFWTTSGDLVLQSTNLVVLQD